MNFEEHAAKPLLARFGIPVPEGRLAESPAAAAAAAGELGAVVVKAQVPTGKRGKAGGIRAVEGPGDAREAAEAILGMDIGGHAVERVLVERQCAIDRELYAAVLNDPGSRGPLVMFSTEGGMDIEEVAASRPESIRSLPVDLSAGLTVKAAQGLLKGLGLGRQATGQVAEVLAALYQAYLESDAELIEINPLALLEDGVVMALDCKLVMDDSSVKRQPEIAPLGTPEALTELETRARELGLAYLELDGDVGVLANGAGVTMTTMDVIAHHGGRPANFLEIGGEAYVKGREALELLASDPRIRSLVINFCGAFARTDVMTKGVIEGWEVLKPDLPVFFAIKGTGAEAAVRLLEQRLGMEPYPTMDEAIAAAVEAARDRAGEARP